MPRRRACSSRTPAEDLGSDPPLFDGEGAGGGRLVLGSCPLPEGAASCALAADDCPTVCQLDCGSARKDLAERLQVFVSESARNQTGLGFDQVTGLIEALSNDADPELFPDGCGVGRVDTTGPQIEFDEPQDGEYWRLTADISVTASDPAGIKTLTLTIDGAPAPPDEDPGDPGHYAVTGLDTTGYTEGSIVALVATATDQYDNQSEKTVHVKINNEGAGLVQGWVVKAPVAGALVTVYQYAGGARGRPWAARPRRRPAAPSR